MKKPQNKLKIGANQRFGAVPFDKPFQGPELPVNRTPNSNDLGREDARFLSEQNRTFTRQVERPPATTSRELLQEMAERQERLQQDAQRQLRNRKTPTPKVTPTAKPTPTPTPSVKPSSPFIFTGGTVRLNPRNLGGIGTAIGGVIADQLAQPLSDLIHDNILKPGIEAIKGEPVMNAADARKFQGYKEEIKRNDKRNATLYQQQLDELNAPINPEEAPPAPNLPPPPTMATPSPTPPQERHTPRMVTPQPTPSLQSTGGSIRFSPKPQPRGPESDERNRAYIEARNALGPNATQEEMDRVRDIGLGIHQEIHG